MHSHPPQTTSLAAIGPNYPKVTPQQKAVDGMFEGYLEDAMGVGAGVCSIHD